jgi:hypothetical protein
MPAIRETSHDNRIVWQNAIPEGALAELTKRAAAQIPVNLLLPFGRQFDPMQSFRYPFRELRAKSFSATLVK